MCSCKAEHRPGRAFDRRSPGNHDTRIQKQPHGCSRRRRMSASSSAIQPAISSAVNTRGSGSAAPSARSREARKSINSCFSAGESETAAASISASVTIRTSVYASKAIRKAYVPRPRASGPNHFLSPACSFLRSSRCVGFCVAFQRHPPFSPEKTLLCVILLGELWPQGIARARIEPHRAAFLSRYRKRRPAKKARPLQGLFVPRGTERVQALLPL